MLLVPGFLYTRLSLPKRRSVAGHLSAVPRLILYVCIASSVLLAAALAAGSTGWIIRVAFIIGTLLPLVPTVLLLEPSRARQQAGRILAELGAPPWVVRDEFGDVRQKTPDVTFSSFEMTDE